MLVRGLGCASLGGRGRGHGARTDHVQQLLEGLQLGTIDGAVVSAPTLPLSIGASAFDALQLPFVVATYDEMSAALTSDIGQQLLDSLADKKIKGLGYVEAGLRHFTEDLLITLFTREQYEEAFRRAGGKVEYLDSGPAGRGLFVGTFN